MPCQEQVVSLYAATNGYLDPVPVEDVSRCEAELLEWCRARHGDVLDSIVSTGDIKDIPAFEAAIQGFADQFQPTGDAGADEPDAETQAEAARARAGGRSEPILPEEEINRADAAIGLGWLQGTRSAPTQQVGAGTQKTTTGEGR